MDLLNTHKGELQDMQIEGGKGGSIVKYVDMTPGMLDLCFAMLTTSWEAVAIDSRFNTYRPRIQINIQALMWSRLKR
jgi:hypothetical protein